MIPAETFIELRPKIFGRQITVAFCGPERQAEPLYPVRFLQRRDDHVIPLFALLADVVQYSCCMRHTRHHVVLGFIASSL